MPYFSNSLYFHKVNTLFCFQENIFCMALWLSFVKASQMGSWPPGMRMDDQTGLRALGQHNNSRTCMRFLTCASQMQDSLLGAEQLCGSVQQASHPWLPRFGKASSGGAMTRSGNLRATASVTHSVGHFGQRTVAERVRLWPATCTSSPSLCSLLVSHKSTLSVQLAGSTQPLQTNSRGGGDDGVRVWCGRWQQGLFFMDSCLCRGVNTLLISSP